jgi:hypothetical protein
MANHGFQYINEKINPMAEKPKTSIPIVHVNISLIT